MIGKRPDVARVMAATDNANFIRDFAQQENDYNLKMALDNIETGRDKAKLGIAFGDEIQGIENSNNTLSGITDLVGTAALFGPDLFGTGSDIGVSELRGLDASITPGIDNWKPTIPALNPYAGIA